MHDNEDIQESQKIINWLLLIEGYLYFVYWTVTG
jgi:hypothetical protein